MDRKSFLKAGHTPTLLAAFLYFDLAFMVWVLLGPLGVQIASDLGLSHAQKGLMVATPVLAGAMLRLVMGVLVDHLKPKMAGAIGQVIVLCALAVAWHFGIHSYEQVLVLGLFLGVAGASFAVALPLASRWYPPEHQGTALGIATNAHAQALDAAGQPMPGLYVAGVTLNGDANANTLVGTGEADTLNGLDGNDRLQGLGDNDLLNGGNGFDRAIYSDATGGITVNLAAGTVTGAGVGSVGNAMLANGLPVPFHPIALAISWDREVIAASGPTAWPGMLSVIGTPMNEVETFIPMELKIEPPMPSAVRVLPVLNNPPNAMLSEFKDVPLLRMPELLITGTSASRLAVAPLKKAPIMLPGMLMNSWTAAPRSGVPLRWPTMAWMLCPSATAGLITGPARPMRTPVAGDARNVMTFLI